MIKKITLSNIQSHVNTELNFCSGVNCIVGSSNNGKTAILRGLYWVRYNRPMGVDTLANHNIIDNRGALTDAMSVTVETDGDTVIRRRTKTENQYIINDKVLNVVKSDVPQEVEHALKLSDTNIQRQMDTPFLISQSAGEVAKYFNNAVKLDTIDRILSNTESHKRKLKNDIEQVNEIIAEQETDVLKYDWINSADVLFRKIENVKADYDKLKSKIDRLIYTIDVYEDNQRKNEKYAQGKAQNDLLSVLLDIYVRMQQKADFKLKMAKSCADYYCNLRKIKLLELADKSKDILINLDAVKAGCDEKNKLVNTIRDSVCDYKVNKMNIENMMNKIKDLENELPDICPLCGNVLCKDKECKTV